MLIVVFFLVANVFTNAVNYISALPGEAIGGIITLVVVYLLKLIPNEKLQVASEKIMYGLGVAVTLGMSKIKLTWFKVLWQKTIEAYVVDLINNVIVHGIQGFIRGLRSDNE